MLASVWIGTASDKFGRVPLLISSLIGVSVGFAGSGLAMNVPFLFCMRFTIGFFAGVGSTARAYVADICKDKDERARQMAQLGSLMMFGFAAGPPIGAALQHIGGGGLRTPFLVGASSSVVLTFACVARMPTVEAIREAAHLEASTKPAGAETGSEAAEEPASSTRALLSMGLLLLNSMLQQASTSCFLVVTPLYIEATFGWGADQFAALMTTFILGMAFTQLLLFPKLQKLIGLLRLGMVAMFFNGCALLTASLVHSRREVALWLGSVSVQIVSVALTIPIVNVKLAELARKDRIGLTMGLASMSEQLGRVFTPTGLSFVYQDFGASATFIAVAMTMWAGGGCYVAVALLDAHAPAASAAADSARAKLRYAVTKVSRQLAVVDAFRPPAAPSEPIEQMGKLHVETTSANLEGLLGLSPTRQQSMRSAFVAMEMRALADETEQAQAETQAPAKGGTNPTDLL